MFKHDYLDGPQQLEDLLAQAAIEASLFLPFTIFRLRPYAVDQQVTLNVSLYKAGSETPQTHQLQLTWHPASDTLVVPPIQAHISRCVYRFIKTRCEHDNEGRITVIAGFLYCFCD